MKDNKDNRDNRDNRDVTKENLDIMKMRLECLKLASASTQVINSNEIVDHAKRMWHFVRRGD